MQLQTVIPPEELGAVSVFIITACISIIIVLGGVVRFLYKNYNDSNRKIEAIHGEHRNYIADVISKERAECLAFRDRDQEFQERIINLQQESNKEIVRAIESLAGRVTALESKK
jgi:hypothetical protein